MRELILERGPAARRAALLAAIAGAPVVFLRGTLDPFGIPKLSLLAIVVAVAAAIRAAEIMQGSPWASLRRLGLPAMLLGAPLLVSWAVSPYRTWGLLGLHGRLQGLLPYLLVIALGILAADAFRRRPAEVALAMAWAGSIVGAYAVIQTFGLDPFSWSLLGAPTEAVSTTGNPNFTGGFLGITLPITLALVLHDPARRRIATKLLVVIVTGWVLARSQGGWAAGVGGAAVILGHWGASRHRFAVLAGHAIAALMTVGVAVAVLVAIFLPDSRFVTSASLVRGRWWQAAIDMGFAHPLVGRGPNSFGIEGVRYRTLGDALEFGYDFPNDPHSVPLSMFANLGILGLVGFIGVFVWLAWCFFRSDDPPPLAVGFFAATVAYLIQSIVSIDEISLRTALWASIAGFAISLEQDRTPASRHGRGGRTRRSRGSTSRVQRAPVRLPALVGLVGVLTVGAVGWAVALVFADAKARQGSQQIAAGDVIEGRSTYAAALSLNDWADYRGRLGFALSRAAGEEEQRVDQNVAAAAADAFSFTERIPYVFSIVGQARILEKAALDRGAEDERVVELYRRAMSYDPLNPLIRVELARVLIRHSEATSAVDLLAQFRDEVGDTRPEFWGVLALAAAEAGDEALAREAISVSERLQPGQEDAAEALSILERSP